MIQNLPKEIVRSYQRSHEILSEARRIKQKADLSEADLEHLALLQADILALSPRERFVWIEGRPVVDLFKELSILANNFKEVKHG